MYETGDGMNTVKGLLNGGAEGSEMPLTMKKGGSPALAGRITCA